MNNVSLLYDDLRAEIEVTGLDVRGGFNAEDGELPEAVGGGPGRALLMIGNIGGDFWPAFEAGRRDEPDPLDGWVKRVVDPMAATLGARACHPNDRPYQPFQRWAQRIEAVHGSPLGILIHPVYGLWHAYRAALIFAEPIDGLPKPDGQPSPCDTCVDRPCLSSCPVGAFTAAGLAPETCAGHLRGHRLPNCMADGCAARAACPVGGEFRYANPQLRFHMQAFLAARTGNAS